MLEAVVLLMEALPRPDDELFHSSGIRYAICGHSGDSADIPFVPFVLDAADAAETTQVGRIFLFPHSIVD